MKTILILSILLAGCSATQKLAKQFTGQPLKDERILCENKPYSDDDLSSAALSVLYPHLRHFYESFPDSTLTAESLADAKGRVPPLRSWANTIENSKVRNAYLNWLDYYENQYDRLGSKLTRAAPSQPSVEEVEERETREKEARKEALEKCLPQPK